MSKKRSLFMAGATTAIVALVIPASAAPSPMSPADHVTGNQPKSLTELQVMLDKGLTPNPALKFGPSHAAIPRTGILLKGPNGSKTRGNPSDAVPACFSPRVQLPCGTYDDQPSFEADHGPFSRALGNFEDFELINSGGTGQFCTMNGEDINCLQHFDTPFRCAGPVLDAGDILTGVAFREGPPRPPGGFSGTTILASGGFLGAPDRWISANYFGDSFDIKFPLTPETCAGSDPLHPKAWSGNVFEPFGSGAGATLTATLDDDSEFAWHIDGSRPASQAFTGVCCTQGIKKIVTVDDGGQVTSLNNIRWTSVQGTCNPDLVPLTLEDTRTDMECLADAIAALEVKLDNGPSGGGTSGSKAFGKRSR
jgi:hypothetical protein